MKKILFFSTDFPFPLNNGGRVRTVNFIKAFQEKAEITFLYLTSGGDQDLQWEDKNLRCTVKTMYVPFNSETRKNVFQRLGYLLRFVPWELQDDREERLVKELSRFIQDGGYDCVFVRYINQAHFLFNIPRKKKYFRLVIDLDDIEPIKLERALKYKTFSGWYEKYRMKLNNLIFQMYHRCYLRYADNCLVCSKQDKDYILKKKWTRRIDIIPNSLEFDKYAMAGHSPHNKTILFCGSLNYEPNVEGLIWFVQKVWPLLRKEDQNIKLLVVGRKPREKVQALHDGQSIFVYPDVPDVLPFYRESSMTIAPIWIAGGTRIKIIESAACRRPVVATMIGAEGLDLKDGEHLLIADTPESFAEACLRVLNDPALADNLVEKSYSRSRDIYDLPSVLSGVCKAVGLEEKMKVENLN
jgi:glycosyltransferase involved in cell wall biosynthesis